MSSKRASIVTGEATRPRGRGKGPRWEREVCKDLSMWISGGERDDVFWRSAMSGGRSTIGMRTGVARAAQAGDISAIDALGEHLLRHVVIDCKHYRKLDIASGVISNTGRLCRFWDALRTQSAAFGRTAMLVAKENNVPALCLLSDRAAYHLFGLTADHALAYIPRWGCQMFLYECFLREARVPEVSDVVPVEPRRIMLA